MKQVQKTMSVVCHGHGFNDFTREAKHQVHASGIITGLVSLFIKDTGCSMSIQENTNPEIQQNMETLIAHGTPDAHSHAQASPADARSHTRMAMTTVSLTIPVQNGRMVLGTWQGLYLYEHHSHAKKRSVFFHIIGD